MVSMRRKKTLARRLAELAFNPHRFNDSAVYQLYLKARYPKRYEEARKEQAFYKALIRQAGSGLVFDVGANGGGKAVIFAEAADRVLCVEPDPAAVRILRARFAKSKKVDVVDKGVGSAIGSFPFHVFGDADGGNTFSKKWSASPGVLGESNRPDKEPERVIDVAVVTLDSLIEQFGKPSYIKIDVEGFELEVLKGLTQPVNLISIECALPKFTNETLQCLKRYEELQPGATFNYCISEPPSAFVSERWLSEAEMAHEVVNGAHTYMEIYMRKPVENG